MQEVRMPSSIEDLFTHAPDYGNVRLVVATRK